MKTKISVSGSGSAFLLCLLFVIASLLSPETLSAGCHINLRFVSHLGKMTIQESTYETAVADFDGDGHLDVAVPLVSAGVIQIYRGNGHGSFAQPPLSYSAPGFVQSIAVGDFNGDGKPDLAAGCIYGVGVRVFLNDGSGGFPSSTLYPAGSYPAQVVVADFNGDGKMDLTVPDYTAGTNQVLLGDGLGGFGAPISSPTGGGTVVAGDFNSDGKMDLAEADSNLKILIGNGAGGFTVGNSYSFGSGSPTHLATADFNRDGTLDLAVGVINSAGQVYTFLGNGMGAFIPSTPVAQSDAQGVATVDLDGDGKIDIVTADYSSETISFARGNGRGGFAAKVSFPLPSKPKVPLPISITTGDFNEDGMPDLVTADYGAAGATVALTTCQ